MLSCVCAMRRKRGEERRERESSGRCVLCVFVRDQKREREREREREVDRIPGYLSDSLSTQSGTNDKSGSALNLLRWTSVRSIKENFLPLHSVTYPHMAHPH